MFKRKRSREPHRDANGRFCGDAAYVPIARVFEPIICAPNPELEAECRELEKYKLTKDESFNYEVLKRRRALAERAQR